MSSRKLVCLAAMFFLVPAGVLRAGAPCCKSCGCQPCTRKVCKLVCDKKKVSTPAYSVECEDFCLPGPSVKCKVPCCCPEGCHSGCDKGYKIVWKPSCGCVRTRTNLVVGKKEKEVPTYKCVVEEVCARCGHCAKRTTFPSADEPETALALAGQKPADVVDGEAGLITQTRALEPIEAVEAAETTEPPAQSSLMSRLFSRK